MPPSPDASAQPVSPAARELTTLLRELLLLGVITSDGGITDPERFEREIRARRHHLTALAAAWHAGQAVTAGRAPVTSAFLVRRIRALL